MIDTDKINDIVKRIATLHNPDKIILFGSYAAGTPTNDSDLDLLIIQESVLPRHRRSFEIRKSLLGSMIPMDILVYTPQEFDVEQQQRHSFITQALKNAKLLYERNN